MFLEEFSSVVSNKAEVIFPLNPTPEQCIPRLILGENEKGQFTWLAMKKKFRGVGHRKKRFFEFLNLITK
jgi:hypothetical protein